VHVTGAHFEQALRLTVVHGSVARPSSGYQREGRQVDRGSLSPSCVTDAERMAAVLAAPDRLINEQKIRSLSDYDREQLQERLAKRVGGVNE
jgi:hypothetical protein